MGKSALHYDKKYKLKEKYLLVSYRLQMDMGKNTVTTTLTIAGTFSYTLSFWGDKNLYLLLLLYLLRLSLLF